jgi:hypothetical protein
MLTKYCANDYDYVVMFINENIDVNDINCDLRFKVSLYVKYRNKYILRYNENHITDINSVSKCDDENSDVKYQKYAKIYFDDHEIFFYNGKYCKMKFLSECTVDDMNETLLILKIKKGRNEDMFSPFYLHTLFNLNNYIHNDKHLCNIHFENIDDKYIINVLKFYSNNTLHMILNTLDDQLKLSLINLIQIKYNIVNIINETDYNLLCYNVILKEPYMIGYIDDDIDLKNDEKYESICIDLIKNHNLPLQYIKYQTINICMEAIKKNERNFKYVLEQTEELCLEALENSGYNPHHISLLSLSQPMSLKNEQRGNIFSLVKEQTEEICLTAVKNDGINLQYVKEQTEEICLNAVNR